MRLRGRERVSTEVRTWLPPGLPPALAFAMELVEPSSINFSGTSASIVGDGSVTFSAVSSLSLNGVFSSTYDNYMVVYTALGSTANFTQFRLRAAGSNSTTGYARQFIFAGATTVSANRVTGGDIWFDLGLSTTLQGGSTSFWYGPYLAQPTAFRGVSADPRTGATISDYAQTHSVSSAYDGFEFSLNTGNSTGRVAVYGLRG